MVKHLKIFFSRTKKASRLNPGIEHRGLKVYSNDDPGMTLDLSMARKNVYLHILYVVNVEKSFSEKIILGETYNV